MALLLRRADEERIATAARARSGRREARVLQGLVSHDYGAIAAAAMALILARGRRRDRFGQCLIAFDDLSGSSAEALTYAVAAGLRQEVSAGRGRSPPDRELADACEQVLDHRNGLTDELILGAANEGEVAFIAEVLARRSRVSSNSALDELLSGKAEHVMALLRMAGMSRALSAGLLAGIGDLLGITDAGSAIGAFDRLSDEQVEAARSWLLTASAYRAALDRMGQGRG
jgi:hypothetical protein